MINLRVKLDLQVTTIKLDLQVTTIVCCNLAFLFFQVV